MHLPLRTSLVAALLVLVACGSEGPDFIECRDDLSCDRFAEGRCIVNPATGNQFCAYPDEDCPSGMQWSDLDVEPAISGTCVDGIQPDAGVDAAPIDAGDGGTSFTLTVSVGGNGSGSVTSDPPGIACSSGTCVGSFDAGTSVELSASPTAGVFLGWSDACSGTGSCTVLINSDRAVGALFGVPGESLWFDQVGSAGTDTAFAVVVDGDDNVLVIGSFSGTVSVGGVALTSAGDRDVFLAKLDVDNGATVWAVRMGATGTDLGGGVAVDGNGDVLVTGRFEGTVNLGGASLTSAGMSDIFVAKLSGTSGAHVWSQRFGGTGSDYPNVLARDAAGDVLITGSWASPTISFGGSTFSNAGSSDIFVAKLTGAAGAHVWSRGMGGTGSDYGRAIVADGDGNVVVAGTMSATVNLGGTNLTSAGSDDMFLAKYAAANGNHLFSQRYGSTGIDSIGGVAIDGSDQIVVVGKFAGTVNFGGATSLTAVSGTDILLAKYSLAGAHVWSKSFGGTGSEDGNDLAIDPSNNVTLVGSFCGTLNLGGTDLSSASACAAYDVFVATFGGAGGEHLGSVRHGGTGSEVGLGVARAADGRIVSVGQFSGFAEFGGEGYTSAGGTDGFIVALAPMN